jgi:Tfp pilus assembly protein FimT
MRRELHRAGAFTLLEISLAVVIGLMMLSLALPSMSGLFAEQRLRERMEEFERFVGKAAALARQAKTEVRLRWEEGGIRIVPEELPPDGSMEASSDFFSISKEEEIVLARTAARDPKPQMEWSFWKEGVREPVEISYQGPGGRWALRFGPLLAEPDVLMIKSR